MNRPSDMRPGLKVHPAGYAGRCRARMRGQRLPALALAASLCVLVGCGYFMSGKWEDDPRNWHRAFGSVKPPDVIVLHSSYWRSPHFTFECQYFFEIQSNAALRKQLFEENRLIRMEGKQASEAKGDNFGEPPGWFAPGDTDQYEVWIYQDEPRGHFKLLIDKRAGTIFMSDYQV